ncbi:hypothetical protein [Reyranella sp. CPCC 100927]|uniref:hypothetical protein n=1 Tax=Reyranella sp. CPCC 100927 TaxID=2599616 RepID=UPI0011B5C66A|nr:hypothetical protein [Reyranella sp. CPCC 100927]TWT11559.1 hypothetical protein FQU96_13865 [Reyranella sp. CPCC 100927]
MNHLQDAIQTSLDAKLRAQIGHLAIANMAQQAEIEVLRAELARLNALKEPATRKGPLSSGSSDRPPAG